MAWTYLGSWWVWKGQRGEIALVRQTDLVILLVFIYQEKMLKIKFKLAIMGLAI